MPLSDLAIRKAKPAAKPYKLADGGGMYLLVNPTGSKLWRWKYRVAGKEKLLALGAYPEQSLIAARAACAEARSKLKQGIDTSAERKKAKQTQAVAVAMAADTFETVAREWMARQDVATVTATKNEWILGHLFATIGSRPIAEITTRELLDVLREIEGTGRVETANRVKVKAGQVFRYAVLE
ncbi:MAG: Arm DNA-binding domain-containing protein, partial [Pseudomonadota bacterium]|nr:Arm DNA-binding domain-containing protein [Pseudomonadota bacterium]